MSIQEELSGTTGMQQQHKGLRPNRAAMSRKQEGIQQDCQQTFRLEVMKQVVRISIGLRKMSDWTWWRGQPLRKERSNY
jgi:hypothetical protein